MAIDKTIDCPRILCFALLFFFAAAPEAASFFFSDERGRNCGALSNGDFDSQNGLARCTAIIRNTSGESISSRHTALLNRSAINQLWRNDRSAALADANAAVALDPNRVNGHVSRGRLLGEMGRSQEGLQALNRAIQIDPRSASAFQVRAHLYRDFGNIDLAITDIRKAIELEPQGTYFFGTLGLLLEAKGDLYEAREALRIMVRDFPRAEQFTNALTRIEVAIARQQPTSTISRRHPSSLRPFYPPEIYSPLPQDSSDECMTMRRTENCFRRVYERHAVVDRDQASQDAKMVIVITRNRRPNSRDEIGIGIHPGFAQAALVLACNNLSPYDPAEARACLRGQMTWRGVLSPERSGSLEIVSCPNGGYFALYGARRDPDGYAWGAICGASTIDAAKRAAENACRARAAAVGIPPDWQPGAQGHGCLLAIAGLNDGIDHRHTLPRMDHTNYFCYGRERQRHNHPSFMMFGFTNTPNAVRIDAACIDQITAVER